MIKLIGFLIVVLYYFYLKKKYYLLVYKKISVYKEYVLL